MLRGAWAAAACDEPLAQSLRRHTDGEKKQGRQKPEKSPFHD